MSLIGAMVMFAIIYDSSVGAVRKEMDATVRSEVSDVFADAADSDSTLSAAVTAEISQTPGAFYDLSTADGARLVGNLSWPASFLTGLSGWHTFGLMNGLSLPPHFKAVRGIAVRTHGGGTLFVGVSANSLLAIRSLITSAFLVIAGTTLIFGLAAGLVVARGSLNRVEAVSAASRKIINGDLSQRITLNGSNDEFDDLSSSLNLMLERIQTLMENLRQIGNDVAHDLRSPLARLRERLELTRRRSGEEETKIELDAAIDQVDACLRLFGAMLRISEVEAGMRRQSFVLVDLSALLEDLAETFEVVAEGSSQTLSAAITPGLSVFGDAILLTQMFANLVENSIRHCGTGTVILITAVEQASAAVVMVTDNGPGSRRRSARGCCNASFGWTAPGGARVAALV